MVTYQLPSEYMGSMLQHELESTAGADASPWTGGLSLLPESDAHPAIATSLTELLTLTKIPSSKASNFQVSSSTCRPDCSNTDRRDI